MNGILFVRATAIGLCLCQYSAFASASNSATASQSNPSASGATDPTTQELGSSWGSRPRVRGVRWTPGPQIQALGAVTNAGGTQIASPDVTAIFWGPKWNENDRAEVIQGLDRWYTGFSHSKYANATKEYGSSDSIDYHGHIFSLYETRSGLNGDNPDDVLGVVCEALSQGKLKANYQGEGYYPIYSDQRRISSWSCAWHGYGVCNVKDRTVRVQIGFFYDQAQAIPDEGCKVDDQTTGNSIPLATLADLSGQQLMDMRVDSDGKGWIDSNGNEPGQKCWPVFFEVNGPALVTFADGSDWLMHGLWSNNAYASHTGAPNGLGEKGCVFGQ